MYAFIWRRLPGPLALRVLTALALVLLVLAVLLTWVFPAIEPHLPIDEVVVG